MIIEYSLISENRGMLAQVKALPEQSCLEGLPRLPGMHVITEQLVPILKLLSSNSENAAMKFVPRSFILLGTCDDGLSEIGSAIYDWIEGQLANAVQSFIFSTAQMILEAEGGETISSALILDEALNSAGVQLCVLVLTDLEALERNIHSTIAPIVEHGSRVVINWLSALLKKANNTSLQNKNLIVIGSCTKQKLQNLPKLINDSNNANSFRQIMEISPPNELEREEIIRDFLFQRENSLRLDTVTIVRAIVVASSGYTRRDLERGMQMIESREISLSKMLKLFSSYKPSHYTEEEIAISGIPKTSERVVLEPIAGYEHVKLRLHQLLKWRTIYPDKVNLFKIKGPTGILLYGPSGCGKTLFANSLRSIESCFFISVKTSEFTSKYLGESERLIREVFTRAKRRQPSILFIDEIDSIAASRSFEVSSDEGSTLEKRILATFLNEMDGVTSSAADRLTLLGATNQLELLDKALLRPGRFGDKIYIGKPSIHDREELMALYTKNLHLADDVNIKELSGDSFTWNLTCADLRSLCAEASIIAMRTEISQNPNIERIEIKRKHFLSALDAISPFY